MNKSAAIKTFVHMAKLSAIALAGMAGWHFIVYLVEIGDVKVLRCLATLLCVLFVIGVAVEKYRYEVRIGGGK